jgi:hypothetical protein
MKWMPADFGRGSWQTVGFSAAYSEETEVDEFA